MTSDDDNIMFGFCSNFSAFCYSFEKNWKRLKHSLFRSVAKTYRIAAEPNKQNWNKNWLKIENLFMKLKVTNIESNRGRTVSISQKWVVVPKNS